MHILLLMDPKMEPIFFSETSVTTYQATWFRS